MTGIRLLMAILLVCSVSTFAQNNRKSPSNDASVQSSLTAVNSEPWRILPESPASSYGTTNSPPLPSIDRSTRPFLLSENPSGPLLNNIDPNISVRESAAGGDSYCLNIRSYVVARDRKNSDSVHLVGSTTCVPASRFRLRTADIHQRSDR